MHRGLAVTIDAKDLETTTNRNVKVIEPGRIRMSRSSFGIGSLLFPCAVQEKNLERYSPLRHLLGVRRFRHILFALAALLWLPVSAHCQLETIRGLELLRCASSNQSCPSQGHCDNGCCAAEHSQYSADHGRISVLIPALLEAFHALSLDAPRALPDDVSLGVLTTAPPELPKAWQFSFRAALPVRAPSFLS